MRKLPPRRQSLRTKWTFADPQDGGAFKLYVTVGIDPADGKVGEIFIRPGGSAGKNSLLHRLLDDAAVLISHLLGRGMTLADVAKMLGSETPIAGAVRAAMQLQQDIDAWPPGVARAEAVPP